jgi:hypothetical protein
MAYDPVGYDFTGDLFCFSDQEGGAPFRFDKEDRLLGKSYDIPPLLDSAFSLSPEGFIDGLKGDTSVAFLGDLVDNEPFSIRVLKAMVEMKNVNQNRVLLIAGNRDVNKIRMGIELFLEGSDGGLPWTGVDTIPDMIDRLRDIDFTFRKKEVPDYLKGVGLWDSADIDEVYKSGDIVRRVAYMFTRTMGVSKGVFDLAQEINAIFPGANLDAIKEQTLIAKVVCAIQMLLSLMWDVSEIPIPSLRPYIGLYPKFLNRSHIIAMFKYDGKTGVMSHGGIPQTFMNAATGKLEKHALTSPFGFLYTTHGFNPRTLREVILRIEDEKTQLVNALDLVKSEGYTNGSVGDMNVLIDKFIHLSAMTRLRPIEEGTAAALESPIVGMQPIPIEARQDIQVQIGGDWIQRNLDFPDKYFVADGSDEIAYNIYGHAPQGFLPTAFRDKATLHVCLDVSKIDGQANSYSFAFLQMRRETAPKFFGRILFPPTGTGIKYDGESTIYAERVVYYEEEIANGSVALLKNRPIPGTPVVFKSVVVDGRYVKQFNSIIRGGWRVSAKRQRGRKRQTRRRP